MDKCFLIFKKNELNSIKKEEFYSKLILYEFLRKIDKTVSFTNFTSFIDKIICLKDQYIYNSKYKDYFFELMQRYGYNMRHEIYDAIIELESLQDPNANTSIIKKLLNSPVIDDISYDGEKSFNIYSIEYGNFSFQLANKYFKDKPNILYYIANNDMKQSCHFHTYFLSKQMPNSYAFTSKIKNRFNNPYYHSYTYDKDNNVIIDLCTQMIMDKEEYNRLFLPITVSKILGSNVDQELDIVNEKLKSTKTETKITAEVLKIALYKEYLQEIGYNGCLEQGPSLQKRRK